MIRQASLILALPLLLGACLTTPLPSRSITPTAPATVSPTDSAAPSTSPEPSPTDVVGPSPSESAGPSASPEPTPTEAPYTVGFTGSGSDLIGEVDLDEAIYTVEMTAVAPKGRSCSIDVLLIPETGKDIPVGHLTSAKGKTTVKVAVPNGRYVLEVDDPDCTWSIVFTAP